jgi:hypothetical protein
MVLGLCGVRVKSFVGRIFMGWISKQLADRWAPKAFILT